MTNLQITNEDKIANNMIYAIEVKNGILNKLPRNIEITSFKTVPYREWSQDGNDNDVSVRCVLHYKGDNDDAEIRYAVNCYNEGYTFDSLVDNFSSMIINEQDLMNYLDNQ